MVLLLDIVKLPQFHEVSYQHRLTAMQSYQVSLHLVLARNEYKYSDANEVPQSLDFVPLDNDVLETVFRQPNDKKQV